jgi:hypothetical protein
MRKSIFLAIFIVAINGTLTSCRTMPLGAVVCSELSKLPNPRAFAKNDDLANGRARPVPTCAKPRPADVHACQELEQQILASTVRLEWQRWTVNDKDLGYTLLDRSTGHATIKEGRYLVTDNHAGISLSNPKKGTFVTVSIFTADGDPIWQYARLNTITVAELNPETLLLDFGNYGGQGLFTAKGLSSAKFKSWDSLPLQSGLEVAQIGWDGATANVVWVTIDKVIRQGDTPRVELSNFVRPGASGGGVFWNGYHIANTWSQVTVCDKSSGAVLRQHSVAALNSPQVTAPTDRNAPDRRRIIGSGSN